MSRFLFSFCKKKILEEEETSQMNLGLARVIKYEELKRATNNFNKELGNGGYGKVYLGRLRNGQMVAVKVLFDRNPKRLEQFLNEVIVLSRLRHKNLVALYGCTSPRNHELLLAYEFVANGTVADHLHGKQSALTWAMRVRIAMETAEALVYLHTLEPPIIHRDVKTSNILLDNQFHVKVADLGICRLLPWDSTHVSTLPQGTMGYRDPEYERYFRLTDKSDVYSFGVVLMELVSGQQAVDVNRAPENIYLDRMALDKILNKKLEEFVDPELGYHSNNDIRRTIDSVAKLASKCLQATGDMRPLMAQVYTVLKGIQNEIQMQQRDRGQEEISVAGIQHVEHQKEANPFDPQQELGAGSLNKVYTGLGSRGRHLKALPGQIAAIPLSELKKLTNNFGKEALIAEGLYGPIFYATLSSGQPVDIKKLMYNVSDFAELPAILRLKDEYFIQLLGYCLELSYLVCEFAPKGTLHYKLHGRAWGINANPVPVLSWSQRVKIAYGAARGLEYLHKKVQPPIVHGDVRSRNVLLFGDYNSKIGDLNWTYQFRDEAISFSDSTRSVGSYLAPEPGYLAPECHIIGDLTEKSAIYGLGVVLLELLTGKKPVDHSSAKWQTLVAWATPWLSEEGVKNCVDSNLNNDYPHKSVAKMAAIAALCTQYEAKYRPDITIVVRDLHCLLESEPGAQSEEWDLHCFLESKIHCILESEPGAQSEEWDLHCLLESEIHCILESEPGAQSEE